MATVKLPLRFGGGGISLRIPVLTLLLDAMVIVEFRQQSLISGVPS